MVHELVVLPPNKIWMCAVCHIPLLDKTQTRFMISGEMTHKDAIAVAYCVKHYEELHHVEPAAR